MPHHNPGINIDDSGTPIGRYDRVDFKDGLTVTPGSGKVDVDATAAGGSLTVKDEGVTLDTAVTSMDFVGSSITATNVGHAVTVTVSAASSLTVKDEGSNLDTAVTSFDFVGGGVKATNSGHAITVEIEGAQKAVLASRPAAAAGNAGMYFWATDVKLSYISDGSTWTTLSWEIGAIAALDTDGTLAANSDAKIASQKATKTYSDTKMAKSANLSDVSSVPTSKTNLKVGYATRSYSQTNFR